MAQRDTHTHMHHAEVAVFALHGICTSCRNRAATSHTETATAIRDAFVIVSLGGGGGGGGGG